MPELPEVETTARGIRPHIVNRTISEVRIRERRLRWPVPENLGELLPRSRCSELSRRGKYLLLRTGRGTLIIHLGMSGNLRVVPTQTRPSRHDHVDFVLEGGNCLRFHDPRRFGCILWTADDPLTHDLLVSLGPEPLTGEFSGDYLYAVAKHRKAPVKTLLMNSRIVVGVGNIYANEALFRAGIDPRRQAGRISRARLERLCLAVKRVLELAIEQGGTTLRDFVKPDGKPGYFRQTLAVYDRKDCDCPVCGDPLTGITLAQRSTFFCRNCQR